MGYGSKGKANLSGQTSGIRVESARIFESDGDGTADDDGGIPPTAGIFSMMPRLFAHNALYVSLPNLIISRFSAHEGVQ